MNTIALSPDDYESIANREESHFFDFKSKQVDGRGIQKIVVAFANADGGEFIIGVIDNAEATPAAGRWDGFSDIEAMNSSLQSVFDVRPNVDAQYRILPLQRRETGSCSF